MRRQLGKALRTQFEAALQQHLPRFQEVAIPNNILGERLYACRVHSSSLNFFIRLRPDPKLEEFSVTVGWSDDPLCPLETADWGDPSSPMLRSRNWFDLGALWNAPNSCARWTLHRHPLDLLESSATPEQMIAGLVDDSWIQSALKNVPTSVRDAVEHIVEYAVPYFREVVQIKGVTSDIL